MGLKSFYFLLSEIQRLSQSILDDAALRVSQWTTNPGSVCRVFVEKGPFLSLYSQWIGEYDAIKQRLAEGEMPMHVG